MYKIVYGQKTPTDHDLLLNEIFNASETGKLFLNESSKTPEISAKAVNALFRNVSGKYISSDFNDIERTKGDITKFKDYPYIEGAIEFLKGTFFKLDNKPCIQNVAMIEKTYNNIIQNTQIFKDSYNHDYQIIQYVYSSMVIALIVSLSQLVSATMLYLNDTSGNDIIKETKQLSFYIKQMNKFNILIGRGDLKTLHKKIERNEIPKELEEDGPWWAGGLDNLDSFILKGAGAIIAVGAILALPYLFLWLSRVIIYTFYHSKQNLSDRLSFIALWLEEKKKHQDPISQAEVIAKEEKMIKKLRVVAERLDIDFETNAIEGASDIEREQESTDDEITGQTSVIL